MSRSSCSCFLIASIIFVASAERLALKGTTCSITEREDHAPYGVSFAYATQECFDTQCNVFHMRSIIKKSLSFEVQGKKCVCKGADGKRLFAMPPPKDKDCGVDVCLDQYTLLMKSIFRRQKSDPLTWLSSLSHFVAKCEPGVTKLPSILEAVESQASKLAPSIQADFKTYDPDIKDDDGPLDDEEDLEEEIIEDKEEEKCPELAAAVADAGDRATLEKESVSEWESTVKKLEKAIPLKTEDVEKHERQSHGFQEFYSRIVETEGGRTCKIFEQPDHYKYDVQFAYTMPQKCSTVSCSIFKWKSSHLEKEVIGTCLKKEEGAKMECTSCSCNLGVKRKHLLTFKPSRLYSCDSIGCWGFYASIRRSAVSKELDGSGTDGSGSNYPKAETWLDGMNHWKASCEEGATTVLVSARELADNLNRKGSVAEAEKLMKSVESEEDEEVDLPDDPVVSKSEENLDGQKNECTGLAHKLESIEQELAAHQSVALDKKMMAQKLELVIADLQAKLDEYTEKINEVRNKMTPEEIGSLPEGPVK